MVVHPQFVFQSDQVVECQSLIDRYAGRVYVVVALSYRVALCGGYRVVRWYRRV